MNDPKANKNAFVIHMKTKKNHIKWKWLIIWKKNIFWKYTKKRPTAQTLILPLPLMGEIFIRKIIEKNTLETKNIEKCQQMHMLSFFMWKNSSLDIVSYENSKKN